MDLPHVSVFIQSRIRLCMPVCFDSFQRYGLIVDTKITLFASCAIEGQNHVLVDFDMIRRTSAKMCAFNTAKKAGFDNIKAINASEN